MTLGEFLKKSRRKTPGLTLVKAAEMTGISLKYLSKLENDRILKFNFEKLRRVARVYDVEYDKLVKLSQTNAANPKKLGPFLRAKRLSLKNVSLQDMADEIGISRMYLSDIERSRQIPRDYRFLKKLARAYFLEYKTLCDYSAHDNNTIPPYIVEIIERHGQVIIDHILDLDRILTKKY